MVELEQLCNEKNELVLLSETHMKYNKINIDEKYSVINKMRSNDDKKGGGLQAFYRRDANFKMIEVDNDNSDILALLVEIGNMKIYIILVYFSVQNNLNDKRRNVKMKNNLESLLNHFEGPILVIGDFNAHVQGLGYQKENMNGRQMLDTIGRYRLTMLNLDDRCQRLYTWERSAHKSVIDFGLEMKNS